MATKKGISRDSYVQRFPDSERGEMKSRASFLGGDLEEEVDESAVRSFKNLQQLNESPTKGDKTPFSRTPRATLEGELEEADEGGKGVNSPTGIKVQKEGKTTIFGRIMAKHRNKK